MKVPNKNKEDPYYALLEDLHDFDIQEYQQKLVDDKLKSKSMDEKKNNTKYSLNLMMMHDDDLKDKLNKAFNIATANAGNREEVLSYARDKFRKNYDVPDADITNIYQSWLEGNKEFIQKNEPGTFGFLDTNVWDMDVKTVSYTHLTLPTTPYV